MSVHIREMCYHVDQESEINNVLLIFLVTGPVHLRLSV